jgi:Uma2 family endonuclease
MAATILDPRLEERLIAERRAAGLDRFDEVWDGVYVMAPWPNDDHQKIAGFLQTVFGLLFQLTGLGEARQGINLSDRPEDWTKNFRVPDVVVFLKNGSALCHGAFWTGAPDFAVEVVSEGEDPEAKFAFYGGLGTRELLLIHCDPWQLQLFGPEPQGMRLLQETDSAGKSVGSSVLGLSFELQTAADTLNLRIEHPDGRSWTLPIEKDEDA